jgi:hypothetical protein
MGTISSLAVLPVTKSNVSYDPRRDFAPIALLTRVPYVLVVHPTLPARNVKELVQIAKQRPGALVYGSPGIATGIHLASEFFALNVGVQLTHIPYKGGAPAMVDLAAGNIALMFSTFSQAGQHLTSGRLRAFASGASPAPRRPHGHVGMGSSGHHLVSDRLVLFKQSHHLPVITRRVKFLPAHRNRGTVGGSNCQEYLGGHWNDIPLVVTHWYAH